MAFRIGPWRRGNRLDFNPATPLYTSDGTAGRLDQTPEILDALYKAGKPVVVFVHGRGKEPNKSLRGATFTQGFAVPKIELGYGVSVLMFNWDSDFGGVSFWSRERPLSNVPEAAEQLGHFLSALAAWRRTNPARTPVLLAHSMGCIVVQKAVELGHWPAQNRLFKTVLLSQPDANDVGHHVWLNALASRESVYVTLNSDDKILLRSTSSRPRGAQALGLGPRKPLATNASYIDLSEMGALGDVDDDHEVFGKGAMNGQLYVCQFFTQALCGEQIDLTDGVNVQRITDNVVYRLKNNHSPGAPCLKIPVLPD